MKKEFCVVDVFAEKKYAGNQLAVFRNAERIPDDEMLKIARETNYSETSFIMSDEPVNGEYGVRIFTKTGEVPFAGHPTLGTAYVIQREIVGDFTGKIVMNLKVGRIEVHIGASEDERNVLWMTQKTPSFGQIRDPGEIAEMLGISEDDLDGRFPVQDVSTGLPSVMVPVKTLEAMKKIRMDRNEYFSVVRDKIVLAFCPETYIRENDLNVRVFADCHGIPEDPATGSANGCLAGYLSKYRYFGNDKVDVRVEQGYEMERPSLLFLKAFLNEGAVSVKVGGRVVLVAKGEYL